MAAVPRAPLSVYMLADHLDAALAAGEDLLSRGRDWGQLAEAPGNIQTFPSRQRAILEDIRSLELMSVARVLKARDYARALATADDRFASIANLFTAGTAALLDAIEDCGDATSDDFETGDAVTAYLRSRGLIAPDVAAIPGPAPVNFDETFLVAKKIPLGVIMDLAAAFLDALEAEYDLFGMADDERPSPAATTLTFAPEPTTELAGSAALDTNEEQPVPSGLAAPSALKDDQVPPALAAASAKNPSTVSGAAAALSRLYSSVAPRREFGQRSRSQLN